MDNILILDQLANGRLKYGKALRLLQDNAGSITGQDAAQHIAWFRCLSIRIQDQERLNLRFVLPIWFCQGVLLFAGILPGCRRQLGEHGMTMGQVRDLLRELQVRENVFSVQVNAQDGTRVMIRNAGNKRGSLSLGWHRAQGRILTRQQPRPHQLKRNGCPIHPADLPCQEFTFLQRIDR